MGYILQELLMFSNDTRLNATSLQTAAQCLVTYLDLGFSYLDHQPLFDLILSKAVYSQSKIASFQKMNTVIAINKALLRALFGRWPASPYNSHTITTAIEDIIRHTTRKGIGTYQYYTDEKDGTYTALYQLTVSSDYALFHNIFNNKYYSLVVE